MKKTILRKTCATVLATAMTITSGCATLNGQTDEGTSQPAADSTATESSLNPAMRIGAWVLGAVIGHLVARAIIDDD